jgi:hypothetical protein
MQYLVEGARGPIPPSPEQAIALLEQTVIPHFEYVIRLKTEGKILAGGVPIGDRALVYSFGHRSKPKTKNAKKRKKAAAKNLRRAPSS